MDFTFALVLHPNHVPAGIDVWAAISEGPLIVRPTSANTFEPLRKVASIDVEAVCRDDFIWRNGRKCLGMFQPNGWDGKATLALLLTYPKTEHVTVVDEVKQFIDDRFKYRLLYGAARTDALMKQNLEIHQLVNCGAIPPNEEIILENRDLFDFFHTDA